LSKEAFEQGWDYPGPDGTYKTMPNYGFRVMAVRTCGNCGIDSSLYWKIIKGGKLNDKVKEKMERILKNGK
jgi:hypothetical protein